VTILALWWPGDYPRSNLTQGLPSAEVDQAQKTDSEQCDRGGLGPLRNI
jgi:hypothetical protein